MITISGPTATRFGRLLFTPVRWVLTLFGLMRGPVVATRGGITWSLELAEAIDLGLWALNMFEPGVTRALARLLKPGDVVVDVGANVGAHALRMAQRVGEQGRVYAFEPTEFGFQKFSTNLALNPVLAKRVELLRVGLTDLKERPLPELVSASWSLTRPMDDIHPRDLGFGSSTRGARFVPLDTWAKEKGLTKLDLVKLDVDGYETRVIRGALETLRKLKPTIVMEWAPHHFVDPEEPFLESISLLQGLGYSFHSLEGAPLQGTTPEELARMVPRDTLVNVIGLPRAQ